MKKGKTKNKFDIIYALFSLVLGMLMGWLAYDLGGSGVVGAIIANIGIWVFTSALLAFYAQSGIFAAGNTLVYYIGVIGAYYVHSMLLGADAAFSMMLHPLIFAVIGAMIGFIVWHANGTGWIGAFCAAVPISLLITEGHPIYYSRSMSLLFDLVCAVILYVVLCKGKTQRLMALPFIIVFVFALIYFNAFSTIFGGWI